MDHHVIQWLLDHSARAHAVPGSQIAVTYEGKTVFRGESTAEGIQRVPNDALYYIYSETKPVTAVAVLQLYEKGLLDLDDPVGKFIPEYYDLKVRTSDGLRDPATPVTIRHLLTMTSGMNYDCMSPSIREQITRCPNSTTLEMVKAMAKEPLEFDPGTHYLYSLSFDVLGGVIEVISGLSLGEYMRAHIFDVCGMTRTGFFIPEDRKTDMCPQYFYDPATGQSNLMAKENSFVFTPLYESGGAGLISCLDDYLRFVTELANGEKLLCRETLDLMRADHLPPQAYQEFQSGKKGYSYGFGVRTAAGTDLPNQGEFGWDGAAGAYCLIDPDRKLAVAYMTHVRNHGQYLYSELHPALRDAIYQAIADM